MPHMALEPPLRLVSSTLRAAKAPPFRLVSSTLRVVQAPPFRLVRRDTFAPLVHSLTRTSAMHTCLQVAGSKLGCAACTQSLTWICTWAWAWV